MKRQTKLFIAAGVVAGIVLIASLLLNDGGKREAKNLVIMYNEMLMRAHRELRTGLMERVTGPRELSKIDNYLAFLLKNRRVLEGEVLDIEFLDVTIDNDTAVIITRETWRYRYVDPTTRQPVSEMYEPILGNVYKLKRTAGHWIVEDLESRELGGKTEG